MKKIMILFMALTTFAITAQNTNSDKKQSRTENRANFTPEQRAELHTKKMTQQLDLNESQQKKVQQLFLSVAKNRPGHANKNEMSNTRIAVKKQLKEILTEAQYTKWEKSRQGKKRGQVQHKRN